MRAEKRAFSEEVNVVLRVWKVIIVVELLIHFVSFHPFLLILGREASYFPFRLYFSGLFQSDWMLVENRNMCGLFNACRVKPTKRTWKWGWFATLFFSWMSLCFGISFMMLEWGTDHMFLGSIVFFCVCVEYYLEHSSKLNVGVKLY